MGDYSAGDYDDEERRATIGCLLVIALAVAGLLIWWLG